MVEEEKEEEEWMIPKKTVKKTHVIGEDNELKTSDINQHDILSDEDIESEIGSDESEKTHEKDTKTVKLLKERVDLLEKEKKIIELRFESMENYAAVREDEYVNIVDKLLNRFLLSNVATSYYDHLKDLEIRQVKETILAKEDMMREMKKTVESVSNERLIETSRTENQKGKLRLAEEENKFLSVIFSFHEMSWKLENRDLFDRLNKAHRDMKVEKENLRVFLEKPLL